MRKITIKEPSTNFSKMVESSGSNKRSSLIMEGSIGEYFFINVKKLIPYEKQARKNFDEKDLISLANTISEYGVRQPLTVIKDSQPGFYQVISGERRLRASKLAQLDKVPCIILPDSNASEEIAIIENLQRVDLHPVEFGDAYLSLMNKSNITLSDLSRKIGVVKSTLSEQISYAKFPEKIKNHLIDNNIRTRALLRHLLKCDSTESMENALGLGKSEAVTGRKKHIVNAYLQDQNLIINIIKRDMNPQQKSLLKAELSKIIEDF